MARSRITDWLLARWGVLVPAGILGLTCVLAHTHTEGPPCLLRTIFHIPCPGCGMTRSLEALWRGDLITSIRYHPLGPPLFLLCCLVLLSALLRRIAPSLKPRLDALAVRLKAVRFAYGVGALLITVWLIRVGLMLAGNNFFQWNDIPLH
ncbi:MAG TPA: DUF2752 domain-containing protein [Chthonomonadaceae bacterium]|nr:DUF2752 domain-containing protein [Chthonomonadaceae bacterium]